MKYFLFHLYQNRSVCLVSLLDVRSERSSSLPAWLSVSLCVEHQNRFFNQGSLSIAPGSGKRLFRN